MHITAHPICGVGLGFELVNPKEFGLGDDDQTYLTIELFIIRVVISLN